MITEQQRSKLSKLIDDLTESQANQAAAEDDLNKSRTELEDFIKSLVEGETGENEFEIKAVRRKR